VRGRLTHALLFLTLARLDRAVARIDGGFKLRGSGVEVGFKRPQGLFQVADDGIGLGVGTDATRLGVLLVLERRRARVGVLGVLRLPHPELVLKLFGALLGVRQQIAVRLQRAFQHLGGVAAGFQTQVQPLFDFKVRHALQPDLRFQIGFALGAGR